MIVALPAVCPVTRPVPGSTVAIEGVLLDHVPPAIPLVLNCDVEPGHKVEVPLIVPALAPGLTVTVNVIGEPVHPFNAGVTVTVAVNGLKLLFVAVNAPIFPLPFRPKPTFTELVQL